MRPLRLAARLLLLGALASPALTGLPADTLSGEPPILLPDLAAFEPAVAGQIGAAADRLRGALAGSQDSRTVSAAYGALGQLLHAYHLVGPAAACYANAERLDPAAYRWPHLAGLLFQESGRLEEAEAAYGRALARSPGDLPALVHQGEILLLTARPAEAEAVLRRALPADPALPALPALPAVKALLGQSALAAGRYAEAVTLFEAALAAVPGADRLHYPLGLAYRGLGNSVKAAEHLGRVGGSGVGVRPADPLRDEVENLGAGERFHLARGKTAAQAGRLREAAAEFEQALAARPESVPARIDLASVLSGLDSAHGGETARAETLLREAVAAEPTNPTAHFNLGVLLSTRGTNREASQELRAALALRPDDAEAHRALAQLLRKTNDPKEMETALVEYAQAVALAPGDEAARLGEAEVLVHLGRFRAARERLEEGRRALPASGLLAAVLARLLAAAPDPAVRDGAAALPLAQSVFTAQPTTAHAATVAQALAELGRCPEAAEWQRKALALAGIAGARTAELQATLAAYERGAPCRPPLAVGSPAGSPR